MESKQKEIMPCSTKCKILASFMGYATVLASPFGLTVSGYSLGRAAVAVAVLMLISLPAWLKVLRMECGAGESPAVMEEAEKYVAV